MSATIIDRMRQPEYTGANRCMPCTVTNIVIALVFAAVIGSMSLLGGAVFLLFSFSAIAMRGYLVPGTPTLTKRYLPDRIHRLFGHPDPQADGDAEFLERTLLEWGVLEPCAEEDDVCLAESYDDLVWDRIRDVRAEGMDEAAIATIFDAEPENIRMIPGTPPQVRYNAGRTRWPSEAALLADVAMAHVLADQVPEWHETHLKQRGPMLAGLRPFLEACPACDGPVALDEKIVESCCRRDEVVRIQCSECEATIFEVDAAALQMA